jgi:homoserine dehydrogenase
MDVQGIDAAQKLSILISIAFGAQVPFDQILTEGIDRVDAIDMRFAARFGFAIKPLAMARAHDDGIEARVHPTLIPADGMIAHVHGVFNTVRVDSHALGPVVFTGQGAGMMPTAMSVVSDVIELGRNIQRGTFGRLPHLAFHPELMASRGLRDHGRVACPFYLRFSVRDQPGVLAAIAGRLGERGVSILRMIQEDADPVQVVMLTHTAAEADIQAALAEIAELPFILQPTRVLRVEDVR